MSAENYIHIVDVSARDGLQNEPNAVHLSADDKVQFISMLIESGLTRIEAGSFVHPKAVPSMANSEAVAQALVPIQAAHPEIIFSYLVPNLKGLERAKAIHAGEIAIFLAVSEAFSKANINQSVDDSFRNIIPVIDAARSGGMRVRGYLSTVFGYDDMVFSPQEVARRSKQLLDAGCYEVSLGDTTALGTPEMVLELIEALQAAGIPLLRVALHFHDTFDRAIENIACAYAHGIHTFDAATGGIGGCPYANSPKGNVRLEDVVAWCNTQQVACEVSSLEALGKARDFIRLKLDSAPAT